MARSKPSQTYNPARCNRPAFGLCFSTQYLRRINQSLIQAPGYLHFQLRKNANPSQTFVKSLQQFTRNPTHRLRVGLLAGSIGELLLQLGGRFEVSWEEGGLAVVVVIGIGVRLDGVRSLNLRSDVEVGFCWGGGRIRTVSAKQRKKQEDMTWKTRFLGSCIKILDRI